MKPTPFAKDYKPTPLKIGRLISASPRVRHDYRVIPETEPTIRHQQRRPAQIISIIPELVRVTTPAMRKARRQWQKQQRYLHGDPPPPPPRRDLQKRYGPGKTPRLPDGLYNGEVPRLYEGRACVVFASGPSLTPQVVEQIRPYHSDGSVVCFGCNDTYWRADYLDVTYACDPPWIQLHARMRVEGQPNIPDHDGWLAHRSVRWTQDRDMAPKFALNWIGGTSRPGLSTDQKLIHYGANSGYQVINLAFLYGCARFLLVGYNMANPHGMKHFFGDHPAPMSRATSYPTFIQAFTTIRGAQRDMIINCTRDSSLPHFERGDLKTELERCRAQMRAMSRSPAAGQESLPPSSGPAPA